MYNKIPRYDQPTGTRIKNTDFMTHLRFVYTVCVYVLRCVYMYVCMRFFRVVFIGPCGITWIRIWFHYLRNRTCLTTLILYNKIRTEFKIAQVLIGFQEITTMPSNTYIKYFTVSRLFYYYYYYYLYITHTHTNIFECVCVQILYFFMILSIRCSQPIRL